MTVPVVGTLLIFSLMIGAPAEHDPSPTGRDARCVLSVAFALLIIWAAIALSYHTNYPIGFFVGTISALCYTTERIRAAARQRSHRAVKQTL